VSVDIPDDASGARYQFVAVSIENVYVCTAAESADIALNASTGLGGCFSPNIDADGPYTVIGSGAVAAYQGSTDYELPANHEAAFSFLTFDTPRDTIAVHVQLLLTLVTDSGPERRRMLLQSGGEGNAFRSYIESVSVLAADGLDDGADPVDTDGVSGVNGSVVAVVFGFIIWIMA